MCGVCGTVPVDCSDCGASCCYCDLLGGEYILEWQVVGSDGEFRS